jgi:hypothetical protein
MLSRLFTSQRVEVVSVLGCGSTVAVVKGIKWGGGGSGEHMKAGMWAHRFDDASARAGIGGEAEDPWSCAVFPIALHIWSALRCIAALQAL